MSDAVLKPDWCPRKVWRKAFGIASYYWDALGNDDAARLDLAIKIAEQLVSRDTTIATLTADIVRETGCDDIGEVRDMAIIGQSLMNAITVATASGPYVGWTPAENPAEIVTDLLNDLEELTAERDKMAEALKAIQKACAEGGVCDDTAWFSDIETLHDFCERALASLNSGAVQEVDEPDDYYEPGENGFSRADEEWFFDADGKP